HPALHCFPTRRSSDLSFVGLQNPLSIAAGILMILMALLPKNLGADNLGLKPFSRLMYQIKPGLGKFLRRKNYSSLYITGLLNGLDRKSTRLNSSHVKI